jgi:hypothetical protein
MIEEGEFARFLRRKGKKPHVVDGLVRQARESVAALTARSPGKVTAISAQDLAQYAAALSSREMKSQMRALGLYFSCAGADELADQARRLRAAEVAKGRRPFKLTGFRGVSRTITDKLAAVGVATVPEMLQAGKTPADRAALAEKTGIPVEKILELVKLCDLTRLGAVKCVRARLYYEAGLQTPHDFIGWEVEALRQKLIAFVTDSGFDGIAPLPKELANALEMAARLPVAVEY